jgi:hypothetical protein
VVGILSGDSLVSISGSGTATYRHLSTDSGKTWVRTLLTSPVNIYYGSTSLLAHTPYPTAGMPLTYSNGRLWTLIRQTYSSSVRTWLVYSDDFGLTWSPFGQVPNGRHWSLGSRLRYNGRNGWKLSSYQHSGHQRHRSCYKPLYTYLSRRCVY